MIADFGTVSFIYSGAKSIKRLNGGFTIRWSPKELIIDKEASFKSDIWAFGCVVFNLFTGVKPWAKTLALKELENPSFWQAKLNLFDYCQKFPELKNIKTEPNIEKLVRKATDMKKEARGEMREYEEAFRDIYIEYSRGNGLEE